MPDTHEAIIDKEAFQIVQQLLERRSGHCKTKAHSHLLSGLVFCGDCGRPMTFLQKILWQELCADLLWLLPLWGVPKAYHG